mmetsp:Transcript_5068/g.14270  ORF Transcript_5068/g.14270 Transcript_5068/m.14270 type:complete len:336 (-) Transcript_5068:1072-2079(-)
MDAFSTSMCSWSTWTRRRARTTASRFCAAPSSEICSALPRPCSRAAASRAAACNRRWSIRWTSRDSLALTATVSLPSKKPSNTLNASSIARTCRLASSRALRLSSLCSCARWCCSVALLNATSILLTLSCALCASSCASASVLVAASSFCSSSSDTFSASSPGVSSGSAFTEEAYASRSRTSPATLFSSVPAPKRAPDLEQDGAAGSSPEQLLGHVCRMYWGFRSHSPSLAQLGQNSLLSSACEAFPQLPSCAPAPPGAAFGAALMSAWVLEIRHRIAAAPSTLDTSASWKAASLLSTLSKSLSCWPKTRAASLRTCAAAPTARAAASSDCSAAL